MSAPSVPKKGTGKVVKQGHTAGPYGTDPTVTGVKQVSQEPADLK